jgi:hypothetical protein
MPLASPTPDPDAQHRSVPTPARHHIALRTFRTASANLVGVAPTNPLRLCRLACAVRTLLRIKRAAGKFVKQGMDGPLALGEAFRAKSRRPTNNAFTTLASAILQRKCNPAIRERKQPADFRRPKKTKPHSAVYTLALAVLPWLAA